MQLPTVENLIDMYGSDVYTAVNEIRKEYRPIAPPKPVRPEKPRRMDVSSEVIGYGRLLENYERDLTVYNEGYKEYSKQYGAIESLLQDYVERVSNIDTVPEQYRSKVKSLAYDKGHSDGLTSYYGWINTLAEIFE